MKNIDKDYKLIPMNEITDEAREIATRWYDGVCDLNDIMEKHKLASDIMNYAMRHPPTPAADEGGEEVCKVCGNHNPVWSAENELFNTTNGSPNGIMCPSCFDKAAREKGFDVYFRCTRNIPSPPQQSAGDAVAFVEWVRTRAVSGNDGSWHYEDNQDGCLRVVTSAELYAIYSSQPAPRTDDDWISVEDAPLVIKQPEGGWITTKEGENEFIAAVPYNNATQPGKELWWIRHCVIDHDSLCTVGDDDNDIAGWDVTDITHWRPLQQPPGAQPQPAPRTFSVEEVVALKKENERFRGLLETIHELTIVHTKAMPS